MEDDENMDWEWQIDEYDEMQDQTETRREGASMEMRERERACSWSTRD